MEPGYWQRIREVFGGALERQPAERASFLLKACEGDGGLHAEVESLLAAHHSASGFMERPAAETPLQPMPVLVEGRVVEGRVVEGRVVEGRVVEGRVVERSAAGRRIGAYEIECCIGHGGMGAVYAAVRVDEAFDKRVAIKLLQRHLDSEEIVHRFQIERHILARLDHPNIARLFDGGTTDEGLPYFVMEHVEGRPIDEYCDARRLAIPQRLALFRKVCSAVQFAHRNLVVHRDLKPSNILVTREGEPKLLDFGIAKLLDPELSSVAPASTTPFLRLMTPDYASPEQAAGEPITTASDVYSLGVLLYYLLTGQLPIDLHRRAPAESLAAIRGEAPEPPSRVVRRGDPAALRRRLSGDLDNIVLMAMRKEPERRYASAEQLSEDLGRHLRNLPVLARKDTVAYRCGKFLRRHRLALSAAAAFVVSILGFGILMMAQRGVIAEERDRVEAQRLETEIERRRAERVTAFLVDLFRASDPYSETGDADLTARELLDRGARRLATELADQPEIRAELSHTIGFIYRQLGLYDEAAPLLESALGARRETRASEPAAVAQSLGEMGLLLAARAEYGEAEILLREAFALRRNALGYHHVDVAESLGHLADVFQMQGHFRAAERLYRQALAIREELLGHHHPSVAESLQALALNLKNQGEYGGAEPLYREALSIHQNLFDDEHARVAGDRVQLAHLLLARGDYETAEHLYRQALPSLRRTLGNEHVEVANCLHSLAMALAARGRTEAAERLYREALTVLQSHFGVEHPHLVATLGGLARVLGDTGDFEGAERLYRRALAIRRQALGNSNPYVALSLNALAALLTEKGDYSSAEPLVREALSISRQAFPGGHWRINSMESLLARGLTAAGSFAEAEPLLLNAYEVLLAKKGPRSNHTIRALDGLVDLYEAWGRPQEAARYRATVNRQSSSNRRTSPAEPSLSPQPAPSPAASLPPRGRPS